MDDVISRTVLSLRAYVAWVESIFVGVGVIAYVSFCGSDTRMTLERATGQACSIRRSNIALKDQSNGIEFDTEDQLARQGCTH